MTVSARRVSEPLRTVVNYFLYPFQRFDRLRGMVVRMPLERDNPSPGVSMTPLNAALNPSASVRAKDDEFVPIALLDFERREQITNAASNRRCACSTGMAEPADHVDSDEMVVLFHPQPPLRIILDEMEHVLQSAVSITLLPRPERPPDSPADKIAQRVIQFPAISCR